MKLQERKLIPLLDTRAVGWGRWHPWRGRWNFSGVGYMGSFSWPVTFEALFTPMSIACCPGRTRTFGASVKPEESTHGKNRVTEVTLGSTVLKTFWRCMSCSLLHANLYFPCCKRPHRMGNAFDWRKTALYPMEKRSMCLQYLQYNQQSYRINIFRILCCKFLHPESNMTNGHAGTTIQTCSVGLLIFVSKSMSFWHLHCKSSQFLWLVISKETCENCTDIQNCISLIHMQWMWNTERICEGTALQIGLQCCAENLLWNKNLCFGQKDATGSFGKLFPNQLKVFDCNFRLE